MAKIICGPDPPLIPSHLSLSEFIKSRLLQGGDQVALIDAQTGNSITYKQLHNKATKLASGLKKIGLMKNDVVCICSENRFEFMLTVFAVLFNGAITTTANLLYTKDEIQHVLDISKPKYIVCSSNAYNLHSKTFENIRYIKSIILYDNIQNRSVKMFDNLMTLGENTFDIVDVKGSEDTAVILCSSGTTGLPKGVMLTHLNILIASVDFNEFTPLQNDMKNVLTIVPWYHAYGFLSTIFFISSNKKLVCLPRFQDREYLSTIQKYEINLLLVVPPMVVFLSKSPIVDEYDMSSVVEMWSGAAPLSQETIAAVQKRFKNLRSVTQAYGLTETCLSIVKDKESQSGKKSGSVGKPLAGCKVKVVDPETRKPLGPYEKGEICVKGGRIMKGYIGNATSTIQAFDNDGYIMTGDIGYYDNDGCFYIVDRIKELIKFKGFQVPPAEVEAVLLQNSEVVECGVVGKTDELAGELPTAFVVKKHNSNITPAELIQFVASKLSHAKQLHGGVIFINEIPKNPSGKILRKVLREKLKNDHRSKL